jgi:LAO/AO transport system kinase
VSLRGLGTEEIFERAVAGERRALGRVLTFIERAGEDADIITELSHPMGGQAHVVGITGAPGAGKSTLTGQLTRLLPDLGLRPAVLAVDPSSPLTGGAILGDRIRMDDMAGDDVFIRSVATRGHAGGLALSIPGGVRAFDAVGYDPVIIETVGVGQVEVDVVGAADTTVVVVNPGWGDAVQANKAGLMEVADIFVINKADRPGAADSRRDLDLMLDLSHVTGQERSSGYRPPIIMTTATEGTGADELWDAIHAHRGHLASTGELDSRREARHHYEITHRLEQLVSAGIVTALAEDDGAMLVADVAAKRISPSQAARTLAKRLLR